MSHDAERIIDLYDRKSADWDRDRQSAPWPERRWHERVARMLVPGAHVLDLGCGSGRPIAAYFMGEGFRLTGVDGAPAQIALARERLREAEWIAADMRGLSLGRRFDAVIAWDSFFHLAPEPQRAMFTVFAAHAASGAPLLFNTGPAAGVAIGQLHGETLYHASLDPAEYRELLARHNFAVLDHVVEDAGAGGRTVWLARCLEDR